MSFSAGIIPSEPAWHRNLRRKRTKARTKLRVALSGSSFTARDLAKSIGVLAGHHSASTLVAKAQKLVSKMQTGAWRCSTCRQYVKAQASYCPSCGLHWTQAGGEAPWKAGGHHEATYHWRHTPSPRRRTTWQSPRRRSDKGKGNKDKKTGKGKDAHPSKGKGPAETSSTIPRLEQLPVPPAPPALPRNAAAPPAPSMASTDEKKLLDSLLGELGRTDCQLPDGVKAIMAQVSQTSVQGEAKALHKLVSQRKTAATSIQKIRQQREQFEAGWASYAQSLIDALTTQFQEREDALMHFDAKEQEWSTLLKEATQQLKAATNQEAGVKPEEDMDGIEEEVADTALRDAQNATRREQMMEQHKRMRIALEEVRDTAILGAGSREHSRTPRRKLRQEPEDAESVSSTDQSKSGVTSGAALPPPAAKAAAKASTAAKDAQKDF